MSAVERAGTTEITFETEAGKIYVLERTSKPFRSVRVRSHHGRAESRHERLAGDVVQDRLSGPPRPDTGKYEAEAAALDICTASGDNAASGFSQVTGLSPGASVTFMNVKGGTGDVQYCTMNNPGQLSLYIDGVHHETWSFRTR